MRLGREITLNVQDKRTRSETQRGAGGGQDTFHSCGSSPRRMPPGASRWRHRPVHTVTSPVTSNQLNEWSANHFGALVGAEIHVSKADVLY